MTSAGSIFEVSPLGSDWSLTMASTTLLSPDLCATLVDHLATDRDFAARPSAPLSAACAAVERVNQQGFRFALDGLVEADEPKLVKVGNGDRAHDHELGLLPGHSTRKLTVLVVVRSGGDDQAVEVAETARWAAIELGQLILAPAYLDLRFRVPDDDDLWIVAFHAVGPSFR